MRIHCIVLGAVALSGLRPAAVHAQAEVAPHVHRAIVEDGDTIPVVDLAPAFVESRWTARDRREMERYDRLTRNVARVYPYARLTGDLLREYEHDLEQMRKDNDQDLYMKLAEAELRAEFEAEVKDLTVSQGKLLIKLIDRETGKTGYDLVKQLRGSFNAFVWQGMARMFGHDLRTTYDPIGDDRLVELIVQRIEHGELAVAVRPARTAKAQARLERRKARLYRKYGMPQDRVSAN